MLRNKILPAWQKGFTLIELLVVIGIIGILITVVLVAINPGRQFASARDTQRRADLYSITNALYQYASEHDGSFPDPVENIVTGEFICIGTAPCLDLTTDLVSDYIPVLPIDPDTTNCDTADTCYGMTVDSTNRIVASAASELNLGTYITVER